MAAVPGTNQEMVNKAMPANAKVKAGDVMAELIAQVNALTTKHNALLAKLDADAGVTDTNYAATNAVTATAIASLEAR